MKLIKRLFYFLSISAVLFFYGCSPQQALPGAQSATPPIITATTKPSAEPSASATPSLEPVFYNDYTITLDIDPSTRIITGVEKVRYKNVTGMELDKIYFNVYLKAFERNVFNKPYFNGFSEKIFKSGFDYASFNILSAAVNDEEVNYELLGTVLQVSLNSPLKANGELEITLQFDAYIPLINHRTGANEHAMWCGNFLPTLAVYDEYGWHTDPYYPAGDPFFAEIANYNVTIITPSGITAVATGSQTVTEHNDKRINVFTARLVRDFAFAVGSFQHSSLTGEQGIEIDMYYYSDIDPERFLKTADESFSHYIRSVGSYPYDKFSIVETGMFLEAGMEYPMLTFIDSAYMRKENVFRSLAHEIGHQWFYNIVGNNQIKESWLDEGLTMVIQEGIFYSADETRRRMENDYANLSSQLKDIENKTLMSDLSVYKSWSDYYSIQYTRGKLMVYALKLKIGEEGFDTFVKTYYTRYAFKIADRKTFIQTVEEVYGESLTDFFDQWINNYDLPKLF